MKMKLNTSNRRLWFKDLLKMYPRIAVIGGSKSGKTTLTRLAKDRKVFHSDDFKLYHQGREPDRRCPECLGIGCDKCWGSGKVEVPDEYDRTFGNRDRSPEAWSEVSRQIVEQCNKHQGKFVVEGVRVPHALRKGLKVDAVLWLGCRCYNKCSCGDKPLLEQTRGREAQRKGLVKIFAEWYSNNKDVPIFQAPKPVPFEGDEPGEFDAD